MRLGCCRMSQASNSCRACDVCLKFLHEHVCTLLIQLVTCQRLVGKLLSLQLRRVASPDLAPLTDSQPSGCDTKEPSSYAG